VAQRSVAVTVEYRILGPLQLVREGRPLTVDAPKQRALLGVLLLHANEVVPSERLVDELWGESPPATALKTLQVYVSQLRKTLGGNTIVTRGHGYAAAVDADALDLTRFRTIVADARRLLHEGRIGDAAETYARALALWRGDALAEVNFQSTGRREADSLDELRVTVVEEWIDCELALGRHAQVLEQVEKLVERHPYRERLREQLMLALYRSGRQAEALEAYRRARRALVENLGLEPAERLQELERAILRHDPSLDLPPPSRSRRGGRRRRALVLVALAAGVLVAAVAAVISLRDSPAAAEAPIALAGNSVVIVDPATNSITGEIPIGGRPSGIALAAGSVWVGNRDDKTLLRIDPSTRQVVRTIGLGAVPADVTAGDGDVWVAVDEAEVLRIDPGINDVVARIRVSPGKNLCCRPRIEFGEAAVWVSGLGAVWRIDAATHEPTRAPGTDVYTIAYGERGLWAITGIEADWIEHIDPRTSAVVERFHFERVGRTRSLGGLGVGAGALWTGASRDTTAWKIDPTTGRVIGTVDIGHAAWAGFSPVPVRTGTAFGERAVWFATSDRQLVRVDPGALTVVTTIPLDVYPGQLAVGAGAVWIAASAP
jgi:YVTN family beta-propeller protein